MVRSICTDEAILTCRTFTPANPAAPLLYTSKATCGQSSSGRELRPRPIWDDEQLTGPFREIQVGRVGLDK